MPTYSPFPPDILPPVVLPPHVMSKAKAPKVKVKRPVAKSKTSKEAKAPTATAVKAQKAAADITGQQCFQQRGEVRRHVTMVAKFLDHYNRELKQQ